MHEALIPYLTSFWIVGSRAGGLKIGPLMFRALQIAPVVPRYTNSQAELQTIEIYHKLIMSITYLWKLHEHLKTYNRIVITSVT
jgi:hypothetical protein